MRYSKAGKQAKQSEASKVKQVGIKLFPTFVTTTTQPRSYYVLTEVI